MCISSLHRLTPLPSFRFSFAMSSAYSNISLTYGIPNIRNRGLSISRRIFTISRLFLSRCWSRSWRRLWLRGFSSVTYRLCKNYMLQCYELRTSNMDILFVGVYRFSRIEVHVIVFTLPLQKSLVIIAQTQTWYGGGGLPSVFWTSSRRIKSVFAQETVYKSGG